MARRPSPSLPDVFSGPGDGPSRGEALEGLSGTGVNRIDPAPTPFIVPAIAGAEPMQKSSGRETLLAGLRQHAFTIATAALAVSLTAPFWECAALSALGIHSPAERSAEQNAIAINQQQRRIDELSRNLAAATQRIGRQDAELAASQQSAANATLLMRRMALLRLGDVLHQAVPFAAALAILRESGADQRELRSELDRIGSFATIGIPQATQLREEFLAFYGQLRAASGNGGSWVDNLAFWNIAAQPAPDPSLHQPQAAAKRLSSGDLAGALEPMRQVSDAYRAYFANWLEDANARVTVNIIVDRISNQVAASLR